MSHDVDVDDGKDAIISDLQRRLQESASVNEQLTKELEAFSYSVSHDLRSPLRSILGFSAALEEDFGPKLKGDGEEYISRIRLAGQKMDELISAILAVSRISRAQIKKDQIDLTLLAEGLARDLHKAYPLTEFSVEPGLAIYADPTLIKVAVFNLLDNASKFSSAETSPVVKVGSRGSGPEKSFFVEDNGIGFAKENEARIFEPFERIEQTIVRPGVGIGLTNARRAVERQGGKIWAESKLGEGATFLFTLPNHE